MTAESTYLEKVMKRISTIILTSALAAGAHMAHAADPTDATVRHAEIHFSDLNLTSIDGATALYHRLRNAAESVCTEQGIRDLGSVMRVRHCVSAAISAAVADINEPVLTAYYRSKHDTTNAAVRTASR
jgi:UrcA family protein